MRSLQEAINTQIVARHRALGTRLHPVEALGFGVLAGIPIGLIAALGVGGTSYLEAALGFWCGSALPLLYRGYLWRGARTMDRLLKRLTQTHEYGEYSLGGGGAVTTAATTGPLGPLPTLPTISTLNQMTLEQLKQAKQAMQQGPTKP